ncbi:MAG: hypothetical protein MI723_05620 [Caulobacterales bacterium]|nr:hypothetical protein [Caulobacterales bacterium]
MVGAGKTSTEIIAMFARIAPAGFAAALLLTAPAFGQDDAEPEESLCESDERYDAFDFWVGEWEVFGEDGEKAGDNVVTREERGCLIVERWSSVTGTTGQSYSFYDPAADAWRQIWVAAGQIIDYAGGPDEDGAMRLAGEITARSDGESAPFRGVWERLDDGEVRQSFEQFDAETGDWASWFVGTYKPKE